MGVTWAEVPPPMAGPGQGVYSFLDSQSTSVRIRVNQNCLSSCELGGWVWIPAGSTER